MKIAKSIMGVILTLFILFTTDVAMAGLVGVKGLSQEWVERFKDIGKFNEYASKKAIHLDDAKIFGLDISNARMPQASFYNTDWSEVKIERAELSNTSITKSKLQNVSFDYSRLTDVTFEDAELRSTSFYRAKLVRVKFIRCKLNGVNIDETVESDIEITDTKVLSSSLSEGQLNASIRNSTLTDVELTDLVAPSFLTFEKSQLSEVNADRSNLSRLVVTGSEVDATFKNTTIDRAEFSNSILDVSLSESKIDSIEISKSKIKTFRMNSAKVASVIIDRCDQTANFGFYKATLQKIQIDHSTLNELELAKASIDSLAISDTVLLNNNFKNMRAKHVSLQNVTFDGKMDFTKSNIDALDVKGLTKRSGLQLLTTESNAKFE